GGVAGRGRAASTRPPGPAALDNRGSAGVRFIARAPRRPPFVSALSSGGVLPPGLPASARPGRVRAAVYEDPPLFSSELHTACGPSIHQCVGAIFALWSKYLGDQWSIGDWDGFVAGAPSELPPRLAGLARAFSEVASGGASG